MSTKKNKKNEEAILKGLDFLENGTLNASDEIELEDEAPVPKEGYTLIQPEVKEGQGLFGRKMSKIYKVQAGEQCPHCRYAVLEPDISFADKPCEFFVYCPTCNAHICTYQPMEHQKAFHLDKHQNKGYVGGFGSAKTYTGGMEVIAYALQVPNGAALVGAATWGQVSDTCLKFLIENIPKALVAKSNQDKVNWYIELVNGFRISAKAFDKEGKIRSANLNLIWVEEASEVSYNIITYIKARLRNKTAWIKGRNRLKMIITSNPDVGWLASDWLLISDEIYYHGDVEDRYRVEPERKDRFTSTHISATSANIYLPPDYEEKLSKNKPKWWIDRYLHGSFKYAEGLVYPEFMNWFETPFDIPSHWKRITGTDFGRRDPTAHVIGALDPVNKVIHIYDEVEESLDENGLTLDKLVRLIKSKHNFPDYLLAFPHQCDPRGRNRDQVSGNSWIDAYRERGIILTPAKDCEANSIAVTIQKVAEYAAHGKLKIFNTCTKLKTALSKYKYPPRSLDDLDKNQGELPMDKNNHLPDAVRYMLSPFPKFPDNPDDFAEIWREVTIKQERENKTNSFWNSCLEEAEQYVSDFTDNFL